MQLLERDADLKVLADAMADTAETGGRLALVIGEPGAGKTSIVRGFLSGLPDGLPVWFGRCDDLVAAHPLGAVREAVRAASTVGAPLSAALERGDVPAVMVGLWEVLAAGPPSVFVIEDLQWADDATLDVLAYLARRVAELPVLFVASFQPDELGVNEGLRRFLGTLPSGTLRITPAPLSRAAVSLLAGRPDIDRLYQVTGGNPFFVTEAVAVESDANGAGEVPPTVTAAVIARLGALPESCRRAVEALSVWPGVAEFDLAERLVGDLDVLVEAELRGLLRVTAEGLSFRHELARLATEATLPTVRRRRLDAAVIAALRGRGESDLPRLVHHALRCGDADTVASYAPKAGDYSTRVGAHRQALFFYAAALHEEERLSTAQVARLCDAYAWELHIAHRFGEAVLYARRALSLLGNHDPQARVVVLMRLSRLLYASGCGVEAMDCARQAVDLAREGDNVRYAEALTSLGSLHAFLGDPEEAVSLLDRALAASPRPGLRSLVLTYLAQCRPDLGEEGALDMVREALGVARESAAYEPMGRAYAHLAELLYRFARFAELDPVLAEGLAFVREHGLWSHAYILETHAALLSWRRGDVETARREFEMAVRRCADPGLLVLFAAVPLARLRARVGERSTGVQLREAWQSAALLGPVCMGYAGAALAEWGWLYGDPSVVQEVLDGWARHATRPTMAAADAEIRRYAALAGLGEPTCWGDSAWALAVRGDHAGAAARWRNVGDPYELAIDLAHSATPDDVREALTLLDAYGAKPASRWARRRLAALGIRTIPRGPQPLTRSHVAGFTRREAQVADFLASGRTNAEIASELFLSVRTIDHHVSAVLVKLGVDNRRAAARRLAELPTQPIAANP